MTEFKYEPDKEIEGGICIISYEGSDSTVNIPEEIDGYRVVSISSSTFKKSGFFIEEVNIPRTVEQIYEYALSYMVSLRRLNLAEGVKKLGEGFIFATAIEELHIPNSVCDIERPDLIECPIVCLSDNDRYNSDGFGVYKNSYTDKKGTVHGKTLIAVNPNDDRKEYCIEEGTEAIGADSVRLSFNLENLHIPSSVAFIEEGALSFGGNTTGGTTGIKSVSVDSDNPVIFKEDEAIYERLSDGGIRLVRYFDYSGKRRSFDVMEGTTELGAESFLNANINAIKFPKSLKKIHESALDNAAIYDITFYPNDSNKACNVYFKTGNKFVIQDMLSQCGINGKVYDFTLIDEFLTSQYLLAERIKMIAIRLSNPTDLSEENEKILRGKITDEIMEVVKLLAEISDMETFEKLAQLDLIEYDRINDIIDMTTNEGLDEITAWMMEYKNKKGKDIEKKETFTSGFLDF